MLFSCFLSFYSCIYLLGEQAFTNTIIMCENDVLVSVQDQVESAPISALLMLLQNDDVYIHIAELVADMVREKIFVFMQ